MKKYGKYLIITLSIIAILVTVCFIPINANRLIPVIEEQVTKEYGVNVHIDRLVLRVGPLIKLKAPIIHVMYSDGQKLAQLNSVKFYVPWGSIIKNNPAISSLYANKLVVRVNSDDEFLDELLKKAEDKRCSDIPNIKFKEYSFTYNNRDNNDKYILQGQSFDLAKLIKYPSFKLNTKGHFFINSVEYIAYELSLAPKLNFQDLKYDFDVLNIIKQVKELDFKSDIMTDLKLYKTNNGVVQASGCINIDNISVLDPAKKNLKSFIYLTLLGDKASIISNIYTSANKKFYVEGMLNNSQKPIIDLKVRTDEIELSDLYNKLKIFSDLSFLKDIKKVNGTMNANFTLKGDLNKIKSNGYLKVNNAGIKANGLEIDKINSDIDFSNNTINITNAIGYVNNAPIMAKGSINKNIDVEILMNRVELKYLLPEFIGVKSGIASLVANISGQIGNIIHKENLQIENFILDNNNVNLSFDSVKYDTNKNNTAVVSNILCTNNETEPIKIPTLKLIIEDDNVKIPETNIFLPNSKLVAKTDVTNYNSDEFLFNTSINGFINSKDLKKFNSSSVRYPLIFTANGNKSIQNINSQIIFEQTSIFDEPTVLNLASKFEKNNLKIEDLSISSFNGNLSDDLKMNLKGAKKLVITGFIENIKEPVIKNLRFFIPQQINIRLYDTIAQIKGDLFVNGKLESPEIVGQFNIQNLFNQTAQLALNNATVDFNKNVAVINAPVVKILDSTFGLNALVSTNILDAINVKNVNIKSKFINTDTLLMYKDTPFVKSLPIIVQDGKLYSERVLANLYGKPVYLTALQSEFKLNNDLLLLKNLSSEIFNGKLAGNIEYNLKDEHFKSQVMLRGVSAAPVFDVISTRKDTISGTMDLDADFAGELISKKSLNGNIKFAINNGRMSTLGKLEHLLYAQNVIADNMLRTSLSVVTKAITLKDTGLFKYLRGDVSLENGIANIKMLQSQGPLMALFIKGLYNIDNDYANLTVLGRLSDEMINGLGAFGDFSFNKLMIMLTGEDNKSNVLPEDFDKLPQLPAKNTKEFRSIINGIIDKPASVIMFNWVSYSQKSLKQKEVPMTNTKIPSFVEELPY